MQQTNGTYTSESGWSGSGGGISLYEPKPQFQKNLLPLGLLLSHTRGIPDVAYDANPTTGVPVYDTFGNNGWLLVGGTSVGAPQWAALFAIVNSLRAGGSKSLLNAAAMLPSIYSNAFDPDLHDVTTGSNGNCGGQCTARKQYDLITGEGTPMANRLIPALAGLP